MVGQVLTSPQLLVAVSVLPGCCLVCCREGCTCIVWKLSVNREVDVFVVFGIEK